VSEISWESTNGYAKTTEVKGFLAWESYTKAGMKTMAGMVV
jgi:hypothetical protein